MATGVAAKKSFNVFVGKIPWTVAGNELKEYFGQFGKVMRSTVVFDKASGFHKGYGMVRFSTEEEMNNAIQKHPHILEGSELQVNKNRPYGNHFPFQSI